MHGIDVEIRTQRHESFDGTELACYLAGHGPRRVVLASGLGTPVLAWKFLVEHLAEDSTVLMWDPRGTFRSEAPANPDALRVADHAADLHSLVTALGWERFVLLGWSMGVQVSLEYVHRHRERVQALALVNGAYRNLLRTAYPFPGSERIFRGLLRGGTLAGGPLQALLPRLLRSPLADLVARHGRIVTNNHDFFVELAHELVGIDWATYFRLALHLDAHSAAPYLAGIRVPTLVTAGTHDHMTPLKTAEELHEGIPGSELFVIPRGTHYALVEYPEILNLRLDRFLQSLETREG